MNGFDTLALLLPCAQNLAASHKAEEAVKKRHNLISLRQLMATMLKMAAEESGEPAALLRKRPFSEVFAALPRSLLSDLIPLAKVVEKCGDKAVTKALYTYRPADVYALTVLVGADMEQRAIDMYQCDILHAITCAFTDKDKRLPTVHDILEPQRAAKKAKKSGDAILNDIIGNALGGNARKNGGNDYEAV